MTKLPGLFALRSSDPSLVTWAQSVNEHLEVWKGSRGDSSSKAATVADLGTDVAKRWVPAADVIEVIAQKLAAMPSFTQSIVQPTNVPAVQAGVDHISRRINEAYVPPWAKMFTFGKGLKPGVPTLSTELVSEWMAKPELGLATEDGTVFKSTVGEIAATLTKAFDILEGRTVILDGLQVALKGGSGSPLFVLWFFRMLELLETSMEELNEIKKERDKQTGQVAAKTTQAEGMAETLNALAKAIEDAIPGILAQAAAWRNKGV